MERFVLSYFECRGRAEPIVLLLELANLSYELRPVSFAAWKHEKLSCPSPLAQLPWLEDRVEGVVLGQSQAIARHVARVAGLAGRTLAEQARVDEISESCADLHRELLGVCWSREERADMEAHRAKTVRMLDLFQAFLKRVRPDVTHLIAPEYVSLADVNVAHFLEAIAPLHEGLLEGYPDLNAFFKAFFELPRIREYVTSDRRHKTYTVPEAVWGGKHEETIQHK